MSMNMDKVKKNVDKIEECLDEIKYYLDNAQDEKMKNFIQEFLSETFGAKVPYMLKLNLLEIYDDYNLVETEDGDYYSFGIKRNKFKQLCSQIREELGLGED